MNPNDPRNDEPDNDLENPDWNGDLEMPNRLKMGSDDLIRKSRQLIQASRLAITHSRSLLNRRASHLATGKKDQGASPNREE